MKPYFALVFLLSVLPLTAGFAQSEEEVPMMEVECSSLAERNLPPLFYQNIEGDFMPLKIIRFGRGAITRVPLVSTFEIYRQPRSDAESYESFMKVDLKTHGNNSRHFILFYHNEKGVLRATSFPAGAEGHPGGSILIVNLYQDSVQIKVDEKTLSFQPGEEKLLQPDSRENFDLIFAFETADGISYRSPKKRIQLRRGNERLMIVILGKNRGSGEAAIYFPDAVRLYDLVPSA